MAGNLKSIQRKGSEIAEKRGTEESPVVKWTLISLAVLFAVLFLLLPLLNVFYQAFHSGLQVYLDSLRDADSKSAIILTLKVAAVTVPLNVIFGLAAAWAIAKFDFRGKSLLNTLIDLPFSISPVVAGAMYILVYGVHGYFGPFLMKHDIRVIFSTPGIILVTVFTTFPFVARELIPIMQSTGTEQEQAALTLGAGGFRTFWQVTLPSVKWGIIYGVILCNARAMGEFGAVSVVSANVAGETQTIPLRIDSLYLESKTAAAFALASILAVLALISMAIKTYFEWKTEREEALAQMVVEEPS
ncbi:MAG: sulfate transporter, inner rane subunit CysW [Verrucomicrobiales bacterium]|nr:sulfate transporter, inner rane subunit CysW [Verrucomicrobiales bacterium]